VKWAAVFYPFGNPTPYIYGNDLLDNPINLFRVMESIINWLWELIGSDDWGA
jgi:hypothetical protein